MRRKQKNRLLSLLLAAALVWFLYLSPRMTLSNAADDALSKLEQRLA